MFAETTIVVSANIYFSVNIIYILTALNYEYNKQPHKSPVVIEFYY